MATILIVDSDCDTRELFTFVLRNEHEILVAADGEDGLRQYEKYHPDIIITDLSMPRLDGLNFVKSVRKLSLPVTIIAWSSFFNFADNRTEMMAAGADICLKTPLECSLLEHTVNNVSLHQ